MWFCLLKRANSFPCTCLLVDVLECAQRLCVHIHADTQEINPFRAQNLCSREYTPARTIHLFACELVLLLGMWKDPEIQHAPHREASSLIDLDIPAVFTDWLWHFQEMQFHSLSAGVKKNKKTYAYIEHQHWLSEAISSKFTPHSFVR